MKKDNAENWRKEWKKKAPICHDLFWEQGNLGKKEAALKLVPLVSLK